jgi:hypothetical protein
VLTREAMLASLSQFAEVWVFDFEFIVPPGGRHDVVCLCAKELRPGRSIRQWRSDMRAEAPYRTDGSALFVCYVATAELGSHLVV